MLNVDIRINPRLRTALKVVGLLLGAITVLASEQARAALIDCTDDTFEYSGNTTLVDDYVSYGGTVPCIAYTNTSTTTRTFDGNGHTVTCEGLGCLTTGVLVNDGDGNATIKDLKVEGLFREGIVSADHDDIVTITNNTISQPMCNGIVSSQKIQGNVIDGPDAEWGCGLYFRAAIKFSPNSSGSYVRDNRIDCNACTGILFIGTYTGSGAPNIDHNFVNADLSINGTNLTVVDISSGGKGDLHDNVFVRKERH